MSQPVIRSFASGVIKETARVFEGAAAPVGAYKVLPLTYHGEIHSIGCHVSLKVPFASVATGRDEKAGEIRRHVPMNPGRLSRLLVVWRCTVIFSWPEPLARLEVAGRLDASLIPGWIERGFIRGTSQLNLSCLRLEKLRFAWLGRAVRLEVGLAAPKFL